MNRGKKHTKIIIGTIFCFLLAINNVLSQDNQNTDQLDSISSLENKPLRYYQRFGPPYDPDIKLTDEDSLEWPLEFDISLFFQDIKDLDVKNNSFKANFTFDVYSDYDLEYTTVNGEPLEYFHHPEWIQARLEGETTVDGPYYSFRKKPSELSRAMLNGLIEEGRISPDFLEDDAISFYDSKFSKSSITIL